MSVRLVLCYLLVILETILLNSDPKLTVMKKQAEIIVYAVSMVLKAALLAATWAETWFGINC